MDTRRSRDARRSTPWGTSDSATDYGRGLIFYSTPGHGGFHVSRTLNARIPALLRRADGWYEEDCDWCLVAIGLPDYFNEEDRVEAERTFRNWHPNLWERWYGMDLEPGDSFLRDTRGR